MPDTTPRLALPWLMPAQAQKHVTVNEALGRLDALVGAAVESRTASAQPASPAEGEAYILPAGASGSDWETYSEHDLVYFQDGAWARIAPRRGLIVHVADEADAVIYDGAAWTGLSGLITRLEALEALGVGTAPDASNPFAAKLNAALWTARSAAEGGTGDLRYTLNKEGETDTLSLLFQSGWSGRAEIGLTGADDLSVKVSENGTVWRDALTIGRSDGAVALDRARITRLEHLNDGPLAGLRNVILNGSFDLWTRGDSFTNAMHAYTADRWRTTSSHQIARVDDAPAGAGLERCLEFHVDTAIYPAIDQRIEAATMAGLAGREVTLSFWYKSLAGPAADLYVQLLSADARDDFTTQTARRYILVDDAPGSDWRRFETNVTLHDAMADGMALRIGRQNDAATTTRITGVQLEPGGAATPFERRPPGLERALCARYFEAKTVRTENGSRHIPLSPKRAAPAVTLGAGTASHATADGFELTHTTAEDCAVTADAEL
ncbi:MAG: DUF2793 domain-containing protein [Oceanicaulis sp.]